MTYSRQAAGDLASSALLYLLQTPELAAGFMGSTGLRPEDMRQLAGQPELAVHVLDYLLEDDARVIDAAEIVAGEGRRFHVRAKGAGRTGQLWLGAGLTFLISSPFMASLRRN